MNEKQGALTHFAGLIRIVVVVLIILVLGFFFVRWASNRRANINSNEASTTKVGSESQSKESKNSSDKDTSASKDAPIPNGIADSEITPDGTSPNTGPRTVPEVGMDSNVLLATMMIVATVYLLSLNTQLKRDLSR